MPSEVISYAKKTIENKEQGKTMNNQNSTIDTDSASTSDTPSVTVKEKIVYKEPEVLDDLRKIDLNTLTPIAALNLLFELKIKFRKQNGCKKAGLHLLFYLVSGCLLKVHQ